MGEVDAVLVASGKALKEWAVVVRAMDLGLQTILLRKGGIAEENRHFSVDAGEFLLLPTFTHQEPDALQDRFKYLMDDPLCRPREDGRVPITHWAKVADVLALRSLEHLGALADHYVWTPEYVAKRLQWKPKYPLNLLVLRLYRLAQPLLVDWRPEFAGCRSWTEIEAPLGPADRVPVLTDAEFEARVGKILAILGRS